MMAWVLLGTSLLLAAMLGTAWLRHRGRVAAAAAVQGGSLAANDAEVVAPVAAATPPASVQEKAPAAWPAGGALPRALGAASLALWRRAFGIGAGALAVPEGHEFAAQALERALQVEAIGERYFPRRPLLMPQLQAAANDPDAPPTRLASIIQQDPVLTGDVLRLANSVYYRVTAEPVESLQRAIITCGTDGLQRLAATALVQPVFRSNSQGQHRFAQLLWERCTRGAAAAETCARQWCPQDRQAVHLLPLLAALGPLVAYRMVDDAYRAASRRPSPEASLALVLRHGPRIAARVAAQWQVPPRLVQALAGEAPADPEEAAALAAMLRAWQAGELLATLGLLAEEGVLGQRVFEQQAMHAGIPDAIVAHAWERLHVAGHDTAPAAARV
jgi:HD-like signal output (HDOD) protein